MERLNVFFLHGFLGRPSDWDRIQAKLPVAEGLRFFNLDYFKNPLLDPKNSLSSWADHFINWIETQSGLHDRNILVGYSLGGRLALHALEKKPGLWHRLVLISTNPGFADNATDFDPESAERRQRWLNDAYWADQFQKAPWDVVLRSWNNLPVFAGGHGEPLRSEKDYSRENLSLALTQWSLSLQKNMREVLQQQSHKVIWVVGDRDEKFVDLTQKLKQEVPGLRTQTLQGSHRLIFDSPEAVAKVILDLL